MTSHYQPIYRTADLPPPPAPPSKYTRPKIHKAAIYQGTRHIPLSALTRARHTHALVYYGKKTYAKWVLHTAAKDEAPLLALTPGIEQHWRIIALATGIIAHEG